MNSNSGANLGACNQKTNSTMVTAEPTDVKFKNRDTVYSKQYTDKNII